MHEVQQVSEILMKTIYKQPIVTEMIFSPHFMMSMVLYIAANS